MQHHSQGAFDAMPCLPSSDERLSLWFKQEDGGLGGASASGGSRLRRQFRTIKDLELREFARARKSIDAIMQTSDLPAQMASMNEESKRNLSSAEEKKSKDEVRREEHERMRGEALRIYYEQKRDAAAMIIALFVAKKCRH